jgi:hypothetical protein
MSIPHLEAMQHYANVICVKYPDRPWERVQLQAADEVWVALHKDHGHPCWNPQKKYRFLPETIMFNGIELPEPLRVEPQNGAKAAWTPFSAWKSGEVKLVFYDSREASDKWLFDNGLLHSTAEAAQAWLDAITKVARGEG